MDDYYKILGLNFNASDKDIIDTYNIKISEYKILPFLTDKDKQNIKNLKKAFFVLSNQEYKKTYDNSLKNTQIDGVENGEYFSWNSQPIQEKQNVNSYLPLQDIQKINKKDNFNNSYISDRIFSIPGNNNFNLSNNESLRPKNVGLSSDIKIDYNTPNK